MTIYGVRRRVACYVTRTTERGAELLVFEHGDDDPLHPSGVQVPAGGMATYEGIEEAALRETEEETGLKGLTFVDQLGGQERGLDDPDGAAMTTFVHLWAAGGGLDAWRHAVVGEGEDSGLVFRCRWEPLPLDFELAGGQGEFLDTLPT